MLLSDVTHRDGPLGRLHEAVARVRGSDRPVAVYHGSDEGDDAAGAAMVVARVAEIAAEEAQWERNAREFGRDSPLEPPTQF